MNSVDHLVVAAASLDDGVRWCEATLGCTPAAGGRHALMGTHNRLLAIASPVPRFARAYLEIIAIDPDATPPDRRRWFGLDEPALRTLLERDGPRLVHWVLGSDDIDATRAALLAAGAADPGEPVAASRGDYRWRITLRDDGRPQAGGALPSLIEWPRDGAHPADALPASGVYLRSLAVRLAGPVFAALGGATVVADAAAWPSPPALLATLATPAGGIVTLSTPA